MPGILEAQEKVLEFLCKSLGKERDALRLIKFSKIEEGWQAKVEVTELNAYLGRLGYPAVFDRNVYAIQLDHALEVVGYALASTRERSYANEEREEI